MITATQARDTTNAALRPHSIDDVMKFIKYAAENGYNHATAYLDDQTNELLRQNGYNTEQSGMNPLYYFIYW